MNMENILNSNLVIIDFEATCEDRATCAIPEDRLKSQMEIIEFAAIVCDKNTMAIMDEFDRFVRPVIVPKLSQFCTDLTSITQADVDNAQGFVCVVDEFKEFIRPFDVSVWGSWGKYDYNQLEKDCKYWEIQSPLARAKHINLKDLWSKYININGRIGHKPCGVRKALSYMGMDFEGTPHRGIDDCRNIWKLTRPILEKRG